ncbi:NAD-dependent epimerase/dehydratase family protein [Natrialbaceae archaeon A-gly3]
MEYFVTGATGFIGTKLVEQLVDDGHDVTALTRSRSNASHLPDDVTVVKGDITDKESMREPMAGVDRLFHMAAWWFIGPGPRERETAQRINVEGTRNVLELMNELDIPKGVYTSTVGVYGNTDGEIVDESYRPDKPGLSVYFNTKWRAHYEVARPMMDDGLPLVIVQPGGVYGPGDKEYGSLREGFVNWLQGDLPMFPREVALPYDHVDDTVRGHLLAMKEGDVGEEYIISSEPREVVDVFDIAEDLTGVSAPRTVSPLWFKLLGKVLTPVDWITTPPEGFEPETFRTFGGTEILVDNSKAKRELGIEHRPLEDGLRDYLAWEMEQLGTKGQPTPSMNAADTVP